MCSFAFVIAPGKSWKLLPRAISETPSHLEHRITGFPLSLTSLTENIAATWLWAINIGIALRMVDSSLVEQYLKSLTLPRVCPGNDQKAIDIEITIKNLNILWRKTEGMSTRRLELRHLAEGGSRKGGRRKPRKFELRKFQPWSLGIISDCIGLWD